MLKTWMLKTWMIKTWMIKTWAYPFRPICLVRSTRFVYGSRPEMTEWLK